MLSTQLDTSNSVGLTQSKSEFKGTDKQFHGNQNDTISRESPLEQLKHELIGRPIDYGNPEGSDQLSFIKTRVSTAVQKSTTDAVTSLSAIRPHPA